MEPKVGVAVPTRNRAFLLRETLVCLRDQKEANFRVLVLDNASTDETPKVFTDTVGNDQRFSFLRHDSMLPVLDNFYAGLDQLKTEYFMWRADDDLSTPDFIARTSAALDDDPWADLAITSLERWHTTSGRRELRPLAAYPKPDRSDRTIHLLRSKHPTWIYGLWRRSALERNIARTRGRYPYLWASDHLLMMPSVLEGRVALAPEPIFTQRILGSPSYTLPTAERLKARYTYASICEELLADVAVHPERRGELLAALEYHIDDRVGPLRKLQRRARRERLLAMLRFWRQ